MINKLLYIELPFQHEKNVIVIDDDITKNYISIDNVDYYAGYLDINFKKNKGAHSFVFALYNAQEYDGEMDLIPTKAIKISKVYDKKIDGKYIIDPTNKAFFSEIEALKECKEKGFQNVISIDNEGYLILSKKSSGFPFYIMDYADCDLRKFMDENRKEMDYKSKVELCLQIAKGLNELYSLGYYHRDLKPDNIFIFDDSDWKIGDLGLIAKREKEDNYDGDNSIIGPKGWLSPEPMNRYLTHAKNKRINCSIDHQSDIFQLGKIFWFIMQGNVPIGIIHRADYLSESHAMYKIIFNMLLYNKSKRIDNLQEKVICKLNHIIENL